MISKKIYIKNNIEVKVNDTFIYHSEIWKIWKLGAILESEKYYSSSKALKFKKKDLVLKKKDYTLFRFISLEYAPEDFLIKNGYKILKNEG